MTSVQINSIPSHKLDRQKWDKCINEAANGTIYSTLFFLDIMSSNWDALILNDYEAVMPLPWKKKYGFSYLYQPPFLRHTTISGNNINDEIINAFLYKIPAHFKYWDIDLKEDLIDPDKITLGDLCLKLRRNSILSLNAEYDEIHKNYKRLAKRMIKKANENSLIVIRNCLPEEVVEFYRINYKGTHDNISSTDYENLIKATSLAFSQNKAITYLAKTPGGETVAAYMLLLDDKFIYSLIGGSNKKGKEYGGFYLLTDAAIKDHCGTERIFRFEGSDSKGIEQFNAQFNPKAIHYYHLTRNKLPWPLKLLK